jgi:hypothetical protein
MKEKFDTRGSSKVLAYIGPCDMLYHIVIVAAAKLGLEVCMAWTCKSVPLCQLQNEKTLDQTDKPADFTPFSRKP